MYRLRPRTDSPIKCDYISYETSVRPSKSSYRSDKDIHTGNSQIKFITHLNKNMFTALDKELFGKVECVQISFNVEIYDEELYDSKTDKPVYEARKSYIVSDAMYLYSYIIHRMTIMETVSEYQEMRGLVSNTDVVWDEKVELTYKDGSTKHMSFKKFVNKYNISDLIDIKYIE